MRRRSRIELSISPLSRRSEGDTDHRRPDRPVDSTRRRRSWRSSYTSTPVGRRRRRRRHSSSPCRLADVVHHVERRGPRHRKPVRGRVHGRARWREARWNVPGHRLLDHRGPVSRRSARQGSRMSDHRFRRSASRSTTRSRCSRVRRSRRGLDTPIVRPEPRPRWQRSGRAISGAGALREQSAPPARSSSRSVSSRSAAAPQLDAGQRRRGQPHQRRTAPAGGPLPCRSGGGLQLRDQVAALDDEFGGAQSSN